MNKRANRVYWLLLIMMLILGLSMAVDGIRADKYKTDNADVKADIETTEITSAETSETVSTNIDETVETTTINSEEKAKKLNDFYSGQVFMGDSIMSGFAIYSSTKEAPEWLNNSIFLAMASWGINSALNENDGPLYQGKSQSITTTLEQIKPKRIFMNLGINEMKGLGSPGYSVEKLIGKYGELISAVKEATPESMIYVINITPCTAEKETPEFSNSVIKEFNKALEEKSSEWGITYVDLASEFGEVLSPELSSDNFVHHNNKAYSEKWVPLLEKIALS